MGKVLFLYKKSMGKELSLVHNAIKNGYFYHLGNFIYGFSTDPSFITEPSVFFIK